MELDLAHALSLVVQVCAQQKDGVFQHGREFTASHLHKFFLGAVSRCDDRFLGCHQEVLQVLVIVGEVIRTDMNLEKFQTYSLCHNLRR